MNTVDCIRTLLHRIFCISLCLIRRFCSELLTIDESSLHRQTFRETNLFFPCSSRATDPRDPPAPAAACRGRRSRARTAPASRPDPRSCTGRTQPDTLRHHAWHHRVGTCMTPRSCAVGVHVAVQGCASGASTARLRIAPTCRAPRAAACAVCRVPCARRWWGNAPSAMNG